MESLYLRSTIHSPEEYKELLIKSLETKPDLIIDDGGDLRFDSSFRAQRFACQVRGGAEETTTGILRLKAMEKEGNWHSRW